MYNIFFIFLCCCLYITRFVFQHTVKPVLSGHLKIDKQQLRENSSLMKVKSIAECSTGAFCNTYDLHLAIIGTEKQFLVFFLSGLLRQVLLYMYQAFVPETAFHNSI